MSTYAVDNLQPQTRVAVLFCRKDSIYKKYPMADVYDSERDARTYQGPWPVVAHPPCRAWGALRFFSKPKKGERALAIFALRQVRKYGGVLEHPAASRLWPRCGLPKPGRGFDRYGGWTLGINQWEFGHRAKKPTLLYIVGCNPDSIPSLPLKLGTAEYVIGDVGRAATGTKRPEVSKAEREHTPLSLAEWLMELAIRCTKCAPMTWPRPPRYS